ncbi:unnamed protein product [Onchocerca flexuosa]|uniref:Uncharacterized protein n=1 Tax=Onchocerca flexuosa TaxID=387005 RepID=A0A3P8FAC6_9BILA|nr:unnamed protein product [Onchocerca flexuosa]
MPIILEIFVYCYRSSCSSENRGNNSIDSFGAKLFWLIKFNRFENENDFAFLKDILWTKMECNAYEKAEKVSVDNAGGKDLAEVTKKVVKLDIGAI